MESGFVTPADQHSTSSDAIGNRRGIGRTGVILNVMAGATIACSFIHVLRGECTAITVIQFWLSLFVGAAVQGSAGDCRNDAVDRAVDRAESRAL